MISQVIVPRSSQAVKENSNFPLSHFTQYLLFGFVILLFPTAVKAQHTGKQTAYPPLGKLVDAGGHLLHLNCQGKGGPTVVIENGSGDFSFDWILVQPAVARFTRVCTYDRAGYAWSEPGPKPRTFQQITAELHTALHHAGINGQFIMVGQSYGGFLARAFARFYPKEVAGMVLVDSVHEDSRVIINNQPMRIREMAQGRPFPAPQLHWTRPDKQEVNQKSPSPEEIETKLEPPLDRLPQNIQQIQLWAQSQRQYVEARMAELDWSPEELEKMYRNRDKQDYKLGNIPLIVLSEGSGGYSDGMNVPAKELEEERLKLQKELANLSSNSKHIIDKKSGHNIHLEDPQLVIHSIREVVTAARTPTHQIKKG